MMKGGDWPRKVRDIEDVRGMKYLPGANHIKIETFKREVPNVENMTIK